MSETNASLLAPAPLFLLTQLSSVPSIKHRASSIELRERARATLFPLPWRERARERGLEPG